ncbi:hypothetical protein FACS1894201_00420 [Bacteroidia bacterium]|nr:hypothetical protein FACS1894201_00420 [Bacteroidia bacterium]
MISDGDETQHKYTSTLQNNAIAARGTKTAYMIGLGQDLNTTRLTALASSSANYYSAVNISIVKSYFTQIQNDMLRDANSFYNLTYLTSKQDVGSVTLRLRINNNTNGNADGYYQTTFNSSGMVATNAGVYLNAYQTIPGISGITSKFGIGLADDVLAAQRRDTIQGVFSLLHGFALQAVTYYADVTPKYVWTSSNPAVATVEGIDFDKGIISFSGNNTDMTVITVKDVANYDIISSGKGLTPSTQAPYFQRSIRVQGMMFYTVTFEANNGTPVSIQKVIPNSTFSASTVPTKAGFAFVGWYKEAACINAWNFASDRVTNDTTLYAKWNLVSYTITYNNMNGATNSNPANYTIESSLITLVNPGARVGYTFIGWEEGSTIPANSTGNKTFTAQWTQITSAATPSITAQPQGSTVNVGGSAPLSVTANVTDAGTLSYQWYSNTINSNTGGTAVGTNSNTYTPSTTTAGTFYYYVVVTNTNNSVNGAATATTKSNVATVTVSATNISVTNVSLNKTATTLAVGGTETLTATILPTTATNQNVTWSSSNTSIATVSSSGLVTAVSAGNATITVTTADGSRTATCTVTVSATNISVTNVSLNKTATTLAVGGTETLTATILPTTATNQNVTWSSSNTSIATVSSSGLVTAVSAGNATITVTTADGSHTATCEVTVSAATAVATQNVASLFVYPNPVVNGELRIENGDLLIENGELRVEIYTVNGAKVLETPLSIVNYPLSINIAHLPSGEYIVKVGNRTAKVVKK